MSEWAEWAEWRDKQNFAIILQTEAAELAWNHKQTEVDQLTDSVFQYGIENTKLQIQRNALQADADRYRKCLQRIVDEGWDRYGCAKTLEPTEKDDG